MRVAEKLPEVLAVKYILKIKSFAHNHSLPEVLSYQQEERERLQKIVDKFGIDRNLIEAHIEENLNHSETKLHRLIRSRKFNEIEM